MQISTHWDREWYLPFQEFRYELVKTAEKIMNEVESGAHLDTFVFDGQSIVAEDFLEAVPSGKKRLIDLISNGKFRLGPWYVMPDELLVSGESLIKNFLTGKQVTESFGSKTYKYGYMNDIFGHIAQMPQILNGFDLKGTYLGRGLGDTDVRHFVWKSPDGSKCYGFKYNYTTAFRSYQEFINEQSRTDEEKDDYIRSYINEEFEKCGNDVLILNIADDHAYLTSDMLDLIDRIKKLDGVNVIDSGFDRAYDDLEKLESTMPEITGELTKVSDGSSLRVVTDSISSYYTLKQENDMCQNLLENEISPLLAYMGIKNIPVKKEFLNLAYKELLKNQPHDSICGCSADQVHKDMIYRYDQIKSIANGIKRDFCYSVDNTDKTSENYILTIFNPAPFKRNEVITAEIDFDEDFKTKFSGNAPYQPKNMFKITDCGGNDIPYQIIDINKKHKLIKGVFPQKGHSVDRYTVCFKARLNAFGKTEFKISPTKDIVRQYNVMKSGDCWAENEFVRFEIMHDGTITLNDKISGKTYSRLHYFIDDADAGNGWFYEEAANHNPVVSSRFSPCTVEKVQSGILQTTFKITKKIEVPECLDYNTFSRSKKYTELVIKSRITLKADSGKLYVETEVENNAKDHRLRLLLPTDIKGNTYTSSQAFYFADKKVGADEKAAQYPEPEHVEKHFDGIIYKTDKNGNGLAFSSAEGFHQAGVLDDESSTISVVMFRSFANNIFQNNPQRCQIQSKLTFCYAIVPMNKNITQTHLYNSRKYDFGTEIAYTERNDREPLALKDTLSVNGENVGISIVKPAEDIENVLIVRLFNTGDIKTTANIYLTQKARNIHFTKLSEEIIETIDTDTSSVSFDVAPFEIKTIMLEMKD